MWAFVRIGFFFVTARSFIVSLRLNAWDWAHSLFTDSNRKAPQLTHTSHCTHSPHHYSLYDLVTGNMYCPEMFWVNECQSRMYCLCMYANDDTRTPTIRQREIQEKRTVRTEEWALPGRYYCINRVIKGREGEGESVVRELVLLMPWSWCCYSATHLFCQLHCDLIVSSLITVRIP